MTNGSDPATVLSAAVLHCHQQQVKPFVDFAMRWSKIRNAVPAKTTVMLINYHHQRRALNSSRKIY